MAVNGKLKDGCPECGEPACIEDNGETMPGADFDGSEAVFAIVWIKCESGHKFIGIDDERSVRMGLDAAE